MGDPEKLNVKFIESKLAYRRVYYPATGEYSFWQRKSRWYIRVWRWVKNILTV